MRFAPAASGLVLAAAAFAQHAAAWGETAEEVAQRARSLLSDPQTFGVGTFSTAYHADHPEERLRGLVASGPEYFAACTSHGDLIMLAMPVSPNWRNALTSPSKNATLSITSAPDPRVPDPRHTSAKKPGAWNPQRPSWRRGMPSKQRLTLMGHVERIAKDDPQMGAYARCYLRTHPDARHWTPGSEESPHVAFWVRFVVDSIYRVGGFGDESSIGWVDMDLFRRNGLRTTKDWEQVWRAQQQEQQQDDAGVDVASSGISGNDADWSVELFREDEYAEDERPSRVLRFQSQQ